MTFMMYAKRFLALIALVFAAGCAADDPAEIYINQVGHLPAQPKFAMISGASDSLFAVVDTATGDTVHSGRLAEEALWDLSGTRTRLADFTCIICLLESDSIACLGAAITASQDAPWL